VAGSNKVIYCNNVIDEGDYVAGENEEERDDANYANDVESNESVCKHQHEIQLDSPARKFTHMHEEAA